MPPRSATYRDEFVTQSLYTSKLLPDLMDYSLLTASMGLDKK